MRHLTIFLFLGSLLILIGCGGGQVDPGDRDDDYKKGVGSLEYEFLRNSPPSQVFQNQNSRVSIELKNIGANQIQNGFLTLTYDRGIVEFTDGSSSSFSIRGKSVEYEKGETKIVSFPFRALKLSTESQIQKTTIVASTCFDYKTEVLEQVCIDTDPYNIKPDSEEGVCDQRDLSPGATGGPVRVSRVETQFVSDEIAVAPNFVIEISQSNFGSDNIFSPGTNNGFCMGRPVEADKLNVVDIRAELSDAELECNRDKVKLIDGRATVTCKGFPIDISLGNYEAPLYIELSYGVAKTKTHKFEIIK